MVHGGREIVRRWEERSRLVLGRKWENARVRERGSQLQYDITLDLVVIIVPKINSNNGNYYRCYNWLSKLIFLVVVEKISHEYIS